MKHVLGNPEVIARHFESPVLPDDVAVVPLRAVRRNHVRQGLLFLILATPLILSMWIYFATYYYGNNKLSVGDFIFFSIWLGAAVIIFLIACHLGLREAPVRNVRADLAEFIDHDTLSMLAMAKMTVSPGLSQRHVAVWERLKFHSHERNMKPPCTVIDWAFLDSVESLEIREDLEEPEFLVGSVIMSRLGVVLLILVLGYLSLLMIANEIVWGLVPATLLVLLMLSRPLLRNRIPGFRRESRGLLVGPGFVRNPKGKLWSVSEAIMIVRPASGMIGAGQSAQAIFFGPEGAASLNFNSVADKDFKRLWQLWNHRNPRPELASSGI